MAADIQDVKPDLAIAERDDVQAIAGQFVAGSVDPGEVGPGTRGVSRGRNVSWILAAAFRSRDIRPLAFASRELLAACLQSGNTGRKEHYRSVLFNFTWGIACDDE